MNFFLSLPTLSQEKKNLKKVYKNNKLKIKGLKKA